MRIIFLNVFVIGLLALPAILFDYLKNKSAWIERHDGLMICFWLVMIFVVYGYVLPKLNLEPNAAMFGGDPAY